MKPTLESRLWAVLGAGALLAVAGLIHLATAVPWKYALGVVGLLIAWIGIAQLVRAREARRNREELNRIHRAAGIEPPDYRSGSSYGFPSFTLTFANASEMKRAEDAGCIAAFKHSVQTSYRDAGTKSNPFDVELALYVTHREFRPQFLSPPETHRSTAPTSGSDAPDSPRAPQSRNE